MKKIIFLFIFMAHSLYGLKIDRVILGCDANPMYLDFWPQVAQAWKNIIGIKPTLALIADESVTIDETYGDIIRFEPLPGIPTSQQAQVIRLLIPALFENEGCILSDMDMLPLQKIFFINAAAPHADDSFIVYRDNAYGDPEIKQYPMCYVAAQGKTFKEIFDLQTAADIPKKIIEWNQLGHGWVTDERVMYDALHAWNKFNEKCKLLGLLEITRIDRGDWHYDRELLKKGYYIDSHMLRPYSLYKLELDQFFSDVKKYLYPKQWYDWLLNTKILFLAIMLIFFSFIFYKLCILVYRKIFINVKVIKRI